MGPSYTNSAIPVHECDVTGRGTRGKMGMRCLPVHECDVTGRDAVTYRNRQDKTSDISPCPFLSSVHGPSEAGLSRAFCPPSQPPCVGLLPRRQQYPALSRSNSQSPLTSEAVYVVGIIKQQRDVERDIPCACTDCVRARSLQPEVEGFDDSGVERRGDIKDESLASSSREGGWVKACGEQGLYARVLRVLPF